MCIIVFLMLTVIGAIAGWFMAGFAVGWASEAGWATVVATAILAPPLALTVHETGHLAAGTAAGMRPVLMIAGPLALFWRNSRFWPRLHVGPVVAGGFTLCVPGPSGTVRRQMLAMVAGGPLASFALALAGGAVAAMAGAVWHGVGLFAGVVSAAIFIATALPWTRKGMASDGAKLRRLMTDGRHARALRANLSLLAAARDGVPPARWPREELGAVLSADPDTPERVAGLHLAYCVALDEENHDQAEQRLAALQNSSEGMSEVIAAPVAFEAAAFHLFVRHEPETARTLVEGRRLPVFEDPHLEPLVRAGLALAHGDCEGAAIFADQARAGLSRALFPAIAALHARWLDEVEAAIAEPAAARSVAQGCATAP